MVWLEPARVHAAGKVCPLPAPFAREPLLQALKDLPPGPTRWVVDDAWIPAALLRDIAQVPPGADAREAFFRWRYAQSLGLEAPQFVQALEQGGNAWLLAGMPLALREEWLGIALAARRPLRSLVPRWLWLYNRLSPTWQVPGLLLSLGSQGDGTYTGTLAAWGRELVLLRQWTEPATPEVWNAERVLPTVAYLQRDARSPQEVHLWGALQWPEGPLPTRILPPGIPAQESF